MQGGAQKGHNKILFDIYVASKVYGELPCFMWQTRRLVALLEPDF